MSPECSQPCASSMAAVASGLLRYPVITCGPRIHTSPSSPGPISAPLAGSITLHSVLGMSRPADPPRRLAGSTGVVDTTGLVSVSPYPWATKHLSRSLQACSTLAARGGAPGVVHSNAGRAYSADHGG